MEEVLVFPLMFIHTPPASFPAPDLTTGNRWPKFFMKKGISSKQLCKVLQPHVTYIFPGGCPDQQGRVQVLQHRVNYIHCPALWRLDLHRRLSYQGTELKRQWSPAKKQTITRHRSLRTLRLKTSLSAKKEGIARNRSQNLRTNRRTGSRNVKNEPGDSSGNKPDMLERTRKESGGYHRCTQTPFLIGVSRHTYRSVKRRVLP